jgi:signal transduction histidine kinase/ligand-binding sensor domain-containing protein
VLIAKCLRILLVIGGLGLCATRGGAADAGTRFLARAWQSEDGLPSNVVRAIAQAADGYLWVGTAEGIVRFDGQRFTGLRAEAGSPVGRLAIRMLFPLANGDVWATTNTGLFRGRGARLQEVPLPPSGDGAAAATISQVVLGEAGDVFVLRGTELWQISAAGSAPQLAERTPSLERLLQQDAIAQRERGQPAPGEAGVRLRGSGGELWELTAGAGLTVTDSAGRAEVVSVQPAMPSGARALIEDREGNLWIGTHSQGLWRLRPPRVEMVMKAELLSDRAALLVFEDRASALWVARQRGGLDRLSDGAVTHFDVGPAFPARPISALLETRAGTLWAAARDGQVYAWKDGGFSLAFPAERGPGKILAMAEDERGEVYFGGRYGLSVWGGIEPRRTIDFGAPQVVTALVSAGSAIWAGTEDGRVFRGAGKRFEPAAEADAFGGHSISALLPDADGSMWIGTMGGGLFHLRDGRAIALAPRMTDVDPRITCVLDDRAGFLWMGTLGGICRADKAKFLGAAPGAPGPVTVVLDRSDGLLTRECTRGGQPAGWRGHDGTLYFSTGHGVARVQPEKLALNQVPPPVMIEEARAGGHVFAQGAEGVRAGPGRTRLEFHYTAITFTAPEKVRFRTQLEGLDETWRDAAGQRMTAYEAVPPGRYRFRVMAENGDGVWNDAGAALAVEILPHFWETRWFQVAVALVAAALAVGVGALVTRSRMRGRLLRLAAQTSREKERARIAQDLHDDLGASLTEISLLANLAAEEHQPRVREDDTLAEVAAKAQGLVGALDEIVWAINPRHDTLRSLAEYLAAFGGKFLDRAGITLRRDIPRDLPEVDLDAERRHNLFLAAREALNNIVKHSGASEVWLRVRIDDGVLRLSAEDNGRGFSAAPDEFSEGLRGMHERMQRLGGSCRIESSSGGTRVELSLPLTSGRPNGR